VTTKFVMWIHPRSPLLSRLHECRVRSNPSRVSASARDTRTYTGPAGRPYPSRLLVVLVAGSHVRLATASVTLCGMFCWML
jgi:hypothetical protein